MDLGDCQALNGTLCFLCTLSSTNSVFSPSTHPPASVPSNRTGDANAAAELLTGTTGVQPVPAHP